MKVMSERDISIEELLKKYSIQPHDLEYILNFMKKENISPQLAMRRIKLFEKLQEKMSQTQSDEKVRELTTELDHLSKLVEDLQKEKVDLDKEIEDTRLQQDLFNAEREELQMQMHALMGSIESIETEAEKGEEKLQEENQELRKKLSLMTAGSQTLKEKILKLGAETPSLKPLVEPIDIGLDAIINARQIPHITLSVPKGAFTASSKVASTASTGSMPSPKAADTISPDQIKFATPSSVSEKKESAPIREEPQKESMLSQSASSSRPIIKENIFDESQEVEKPSTTPAPKAEPTPPAKPEPKPKPREESRPAKIDVTTKPVTDESAVSSKIEKILKLFMSYAQQADTDENWKARIAAICDMDEAYIELGGLAMSQIYAYQTQSIKKKKEFERLINSWIENGIPR
ncbi:MAG: hypothetical protein GPJ51_00870 [Candidatus Heimdallarchaeota archaeon]|nr:hypothetical protein [Candidatus Heimdallarchaeota archaeon]